MLTVEVGGSSIQAIHFATPMKGEVVPLAQYHAEPWLLAAPGLVEGDRIRGAHHLGWLDVRASHELLMPAPPLLSMNDAEAATLGEWWLPFGPQRCEGCERVGCLNAQIGGHGPPTRSTTR